MILSAESLDSLSKMINEIGTMQYNNNLISKKNCKCEVSMTNRPKHNNGISPSQIKYGKHTCVLRECEFTMGQLVSLVIEKEKKKNIIG